MARKKYYDPQNGQHYYHGEHLGASNWGAPESDKDESYINQYNYTPSYNAYQQYLEEERRRLEEERRRQQAAVQGTPYEPPYDSRQGFKGIKAGAAADIPSPDNYLVPNNPTDSPEYKEWEARKLKEQSQPQNTSVIPTAPTMETPKIMSEKDKDLLGSIADAKNNAQKVEKQASVDFMKLSPQERYNMYIDELEDTAKKNGTLPQNQRNEVSEYMYRHLSDEERKAIDVIMSAEEESFGNYINGTSTDYDQRGKTVSDLKNSPQAKRNAEREKARTDAINTLKDLGWDDERINRDVARFEELQDYRTTQRLNESLAIDPNASSSERLLRGVGNTLSSVPSAIYRGIEALGSERGAYGKNLSSKYRYSTNRANEAYNQVAENAIGSDHPTGQYLYRTGVSTGESLVTMLATGALTGGLGLPAGVGKAATLIPFSANAYDNGYEDAVNRGMSESQAIGYGLTVGGIEAATEIFSVDRLWDMATATKVGRNLFADLAAQALIEGSEEVASELGDRLADYLAVEIGGTGKTQKQLDMEEYMASHPDATQDEAANYAATKFAQEVGLAGLGGVLSGGVDASFATGVRGFRSKYGSNLTQAISDRYQNLNVEGDSAYEQKLTADKERYENNPTQYIADNYKVKTEEDAKIKDALQEIADKEKSGKALSVSDKAFITENVLQNSDQFNQEYVEDLFDTGEDSKVPYEFRDVKQHVTEDEARKMLSEAAKAGDTEAFIDAMQKTRNSSVEEVAKNAEEIISLYAMQAQGNGISSQAIGNSILTEKKAYIAGLEGRDFDTTGLSDRVKLAYNSGLQQNLENKAKIIVSAKSAVDNALVKKKGGETVRLTGKFDKEGIITESGESVKVEDLDFVSDSAITRAYVEANRYNNINTKTAFISAIEDNTDIDHFSNGFRRIYDLGMTGVSEAEATKGFSFLSQEQKKIAYEAGLRDARVKASKELDKAWGVKRKGSGTVINDAGLADQKAVEFLEKIAQKIGYDIRITDKDADFQGKKNARGMISSSNSTIFVRPSKVIAVYHELGEFAETYNKEGYDDLKKAVADVAIKKFGADRYSDMLGEYRLLYARAGQDSSADEMSGEMLNDSISAMLSTEEGSQMFADYLAGNYVPKKARTIGQQASEVVKKLSDTIKRLTGTEKAEAYSLGSKESDNKTRYAQAVYSIADDLAKHADKFIEVLDTAIQNYQAQTEGVGGADKFSLMMEYNTNTYSSLIDDNEKALIQSEIKDLKKQLDNWNGQDAGIHFVVCKNTPEIIQENLSFKDLEIQIDSKKVIKLLNDHPEMKDLLPFLPKLMHDPVLIMDSRTVGDANVIYGSLIAANKKPVMVSIKPVPITKRGITIDVNLITNAYAKNSTDMQFSKSKVIYITPDAEIRNEWEKLTQLQLPFLNLPFANLKIADLEEKSKENFSLEVDSSGKELTEGQKKFYADESPLLLDENGALKRYYHGTARMDRVGTVFDPARATSGPMAYFTDNKEIAERYSKDKADTSLSRDERYDTYYTQFRLNLNGKDVSIPDAWNLLPASKKEEIKQKAGHIAFDDDYEEIKYYPDKTEGNGAFNRYELNRHKGNYLETLVDTWLETGDLLDREEDFLKVLELVGIDGAEYLNPDARNEGVYEVYIHATNPLDTTNIPKKVVNALKKRARTVEFFEGDMQADMWDKNNVRPEKWVSRLEDDIKNGTTHSWTSIPDWVTAVLKEQGYDAISDLGGKGGGAGHQVVIPFESNQVKSIDNENPTENNDIRYSIDADEDRIYYAPRLRGNLEIVKNATNEEYQQMREDILKEMPWLRGTDTPLLRHTYDEEGNTYYWDASQGIHAQVEPLINKHWNTRTSQHWEWWLKDNKDEWPIDYSARYSLGGIGAFMADTNMLDKAREMEENGETVDEIFDQTGWYRGADKKWRFEIDDSDAKIKDDFLNNYVKGTKMYYLKDVLDFDELYYRYPGLRTVKVYVDDVPGNAAAMYSSKDNTITIDEINGIKGYANMAKTPQDELTETMLHEVQHAIQYIEHFASGSNPGMWARRDRGPVMYTRGDMNKYFQAQDKLKNLKESSPKELVEGFKRIDWLTSLGEVLAMKDLYKELKAKYGDQFEKYYDADAEVKWFEPSYEELSAYEAYEMTAGEIEARDVEERHSWNKDMRKIIPTTKTDKGVLFAENMDNPWEAPEKFSLDVDSEGKSLTEDQKEYFKESQIRDENGNLKVMYHGSNAGGFTIFDPKKADDKVSLFFTDNANVADSYIYYNYGETRKSQVTYKSDIPKITDIDTAVAFLEDNGYTNFTKNTEGRYPRWSFNDPSMSGHRIYEWSQKDIIAEANSLRNGRKGLYKVYLDVQNPLIVDGGNKIEGVVDDIVIAKHKGDFGHIIAFSFNTPTGEEMIKKNKSEVDSYIDETFGKDAEKVKKAVNDLIANGKYYEGKHLKNIYVNTVVPSNWNNIKFNGGRANTRYIAGYAHEQGYDGVYFKNITDNGGASGDYEGASNIVVAFHSDQVKAVDNLKPTTDPDIRYSIEVDSEGRTLTEGQQNYFNDSKVVDDNGALKVMYHGARGAGFTVFDSSHSDDKRSLFFTDDPRVAKSYVGTFEKFKPLKPMTFDELASAIEGYTGGDIYLDEDGNDVVIMEVGTIQEGDKEVYRGSLKGAQEYFIDSTKDDYSNADANYEVYLNLQNPYIMDAHGANWDELPVPDDLYEHHYQNFEIHGGSDDVFTVDYEDENGSHTETFETFGDIEKKFGEIYEDFDMESEEIYIENLYVDENGNRLPTNTRMYAQFAQENGRDGVIIKNVYDIGVYASSEDRVASTIAIAFSPEQIKDIDNINPTSSEDIRYSLDLDDDPFLDIEAILSENSSVRDSEEKAIDILEKGMEALENKEVDVPKLRTLALKLRNEYGSTYNTNTFTENLRKAFAFMQTEDHVDYKTMMGILRDIARPVIEQSGEKVGEQEYKDFISYFKDKKIKLTEKQKEEVKYTFGTYGAFRNAIMPITISDNGSTTLDQLWDEIVEQSGYVLDRDTVEGDMPAALLDVLHAMRPTVRNDFGGDIEDVSRDLAMRIVQEYIEGEASKQMKQEISEIRSRLKKDYQERMKEARGKANEEVRARNKRRAENAKERELVRDLKHDIKLNANKLLTWAAKPTEGKSIPHDMMMPVMQFLQAIDFVDPIIRATEDGKYYTKVFDRVDYENGKKKLIYKDIIGDTYSDVLRQFNEAIGRGEGSKDQRSWTERMQGIRDIYNKVLHDDDFEDNSMQMLLQGLDSQGLSEEFDDLLSRNRGQVDMNHLSSGDLTLINNIIKNIFHAVNQGNKAYSSANVDIVNLAQSTIQDAEGKEIKNRSGIMEGIHKMLRLDNVTPRTFFKLLGNRGHEIYQFLRGGLNQEIRDLKKASEFMSEAMKGIDAKKWTGRDAIIHEFALSFGSVRMTEGQILGLYYTLRRNGGMDRISKEGIRVDDIKTKHDKIRRQNPIRLTDADIKKIESVLTPEQIELGKKMQQYMASDCSEMGNETSMRLYGYKKFTDDTYYPWTVDRDTVPTNNTSENIPMFTGIERSGFTKQLKEGASNPLVIKDIFDVFTDHVAQMAAYHGYAAAVKDTLRWMNYKEKTPDGGIYNKKAINKLAGSDSGVSYITTLLLDINKANKSRYVGNFTDRLIGNYKAAAVGANGRVVLQQFAAYFRALNMIDAKYLLSVNPVTAVRNIKKSQEESPISWWKSKGYYETNLGQPIKEIVTGIATPAEKAKDIMMSPAGWADDVTWGFLYTAVEKEQRDKLKGQNISAEEFRKAVNDRFDEVVDNTQVVDSTLHRSQYMRSTDRLNKLQTAFMAEPTKSYNMLLEAAVEDMNEGKTGKRTSRAVASFLLSALATSAAAAVYDAMRKAKDDDEWWEVWLKNLQENMADNMNPFNLLPVVKDLSAGIYNLMTGQSTFGQSGNRFDIEAISSFMTAAQEISKKIEGESKKTGYGFALTLLKPLSQITGIPVYNLTRDTVALYNAFFKNIETTVNSQTAGRTEVKKEFVKDVDRERSEEALDKGIIDALNHGVSIYDLKGAVQSEYKNKYFDLYTEGKVEEATEVANIAARAYARMGLTDEEIDEIISEWQEEVVTYAPLDKAIASGENIAVETMKLKDFKDEEKIIKHLVDRYAETLAFEDTHDTESHWRENVEKALHTIDPTLDFDDTHEEALQKKKEQEEKNAIQAHNTEMKGDFFDAVDKKDGSAGRKALETMKSEGVEAKAVKSAVSSRYHEIWKEAKTQAEKDKAKNDWKSAYTLVNNVYGVDSKDLDKTWSDWEKKQD